MADEQVSLSYVIDTDDVKAAEAAMKSLRTASDATAASAGRVEAAAKGASKGTGDFGRSALELGRITQDFAQGGFGGIINNLEGFARAVGGGPGLAGALTVLGVGFLLLKEPIKGFIASMSDGGREIPKSADAVERLSDALKNTREKLDGLREGWDGSAKSLAEYNRLTAEQIRLEKEADAAKRVKAAEEGPTREGKAAAPDAKVRADFLKESAQWGADEVKEIGDAIAQDILTPLRDRLKEIDAALAEENRLPKFIARRGPDGQWGNVPSPLFRERAARDQGLREERKGLEGLMAQAEPQARDVVDRVIKGDEAAIKRAMRTWITDSMRGALQQALDLPAQRKAAADADARRKSDDVARKAQEDARREIEDPIRRKAEEQQASAQRERSQTDAERKARLDSRKKRVERYGDEDAENAKSTPEEERQSEAIEAIQKRGAGKDWTPEEWMKAANEAIAARAANVDGRGSIDAAIRSVEDGRGKRADAAERARTEADIDRGTGGQLTPDQVGEAAKKAQGYMARGFGRGESMDAAVRELLMANAELMRTVQELQNGTAQSVQAARWQRQQASQMRQMNPSILNRGGG